MKCVVIIQKEYLSGIKKVTDKINNIAIPEKGNPVDSMLKTVLFQMGC